MRTSKRKEKEKEKERGGRMKERSSRNSSRERKRERERERERLGGNRKILDAQTNALKITDEDSNTTCRCISN